VTSTDLATIAAASHELFLLTSDRLGEVFAEHRLTPATAHALWIVDPEQPPPSMKVMAERLYCNASNLTFVTNQLVDRGLVERAVDPADRRSRVLELTERGRHVREQIIRATLERTPFAVLDADEIALLKALLVKALGEAGMGRVKSAEDTTPRP
jgi:DNA-binding MarR family transcriptional regulator